ncbi:hypothetical protein RsoM2USA_53 [Ralstonia phage RsoM2USA]|nr:hypothetical protein RsoM2USA_53 [Ralstonia phage RsoM2USA]
MALTAGAKKFLVLVAVTGILGGGYYYAKTSGLLDKKAAPAVEEPQAATPAPEPKVEITQPVNPPIVQSEQSREVTKPVEEVVNSEPREVPRKTEPVRKVERAPHQDQSSDKAIKSLKSLNTL